MTWSPLFDSRKFVSDGCSRHSFFKKKKAYDLFVWRTSKIYCQQNTVNGHYSHLYNGSLELTSPKRINKFPFSLPAVTRSRHSNHCFREAQFQKLPQIEVMQYLSGSGLCHATKFPLGLIIPTARNNSISFIFRWNNIPLHIFHIILSIHLFTGT